MEEEKEGFGEIKKGEEEEEGRKKGRKEKQ